MARYHFAPKYIPTTVEVLEQQGSYVEEITLTNVTGSTVTVTISDRQSPPMNLIGPVGIEGGTTYVIRFGARWCPEGITWVASASNSIVGYMRYRK